MSITFDCSTCGKKLKVKDEYAGKRAICPFCQAKISVPSDEVLDAEIVHEGDEGGSYVMQDAEVEQPEEPAGKRKGRREDDEEEEEARRPCPMCGELIRIRASKCRYCGEIFDPELRRSQGRRGRRDDPDASMTAGDWVIAILCSGIGCICGIVWIIQGKPKGVKMLAISFGMVVFWNVVNILIRVAAGRL